MELMPIHTLEEYRTAIRLLLPVGRWWDKQLADPQSDISLWCDAAADELYRVQLRVSTLLAEAFPATADELLADWERAYGLSGAGVDMYARRAGILSKRTDSLNLVLWETVAANFGFRFIGISSVGKPFQLGLSMLNERMWGIRVWNILKVEIEVPQAADVEQYEAHMRKACLAHQTIQFIYKEQIA